MLRFWLKNKKIQGAQKPLTNDVRTNLNLFFIFFIYLVFELTRLPLIEVMRLTYQHPSLLQRVA